MTSPALSRIASIALLVMVAAGLQLNAAERTIHPAYHAMELAAPAPLLMPQDDGTISLNVDAAAIIQWPGGNPYDGTPQLVNGNQGSLKVEDGHIVIWNGFKERPYWRISVPEDKRYRVVITRSAAAGRESTAWISFWSKDGSGEQARVGSAIKPTGRWDVWSPFEMGEATLRAGEYLVEYTPREWVSATYLINLVDIRLIPVDELRAAESAFARVIARSGIADAPPVKAAENAMLANTALLNRCQETLKKCDFSSFQEYREFLSFDAASAGLGAVKARQDVLALAHREAVIAESRRLATAGKLAPDDREAIQKYLTLVDAFDKAATRDYPKAYFTQPVETESEPSPSPASHEPLFPTGNLAKLPILTHASDAKMTELVAAPAPDMEARARAFDERNHDQNLADLCRRFSRTLVPGTPGLETFEALVTQKKYREALLAYRTYFFEKLGNPEKFGGCDENFVYTLVRSSGKKLLLKSPDPVALDINRVGGSWVKNRNEVFVIRHGLPGRAVWAPLDLELPAEAMDGASANMEHPWWSWNNPAGRAMRIRIEVWNSLRMLAGNNGPWQSWSGFFPNLLFDYTVNGSKESLDLYAAYMDDYCMNARADQNRCLVDIRQVTELETQMLRGHLNLLRIIYDERPAFAEEMDPATLARMMMMLVTDYAPYTIRMRRAEQANWGIMGLGHLHNVAALLPEFKAMQYFNRETWRAQMANTIQHRTLDGENLEAWDLGHNFVDTAYQLYSIPFARPIAETDDMFLANFWDNVKVMQRNWVVHLSPSGFYWPTWSPNPNLAMNNFKTHMHVPMHLGRYHQDLVIEEPWVAKRVELATSADTRSVNDPDTRSDGEPLSDIAPYGAMAYLREGWANNADYLIFMNWHRRSQENESASRTGYLISRSERILLEAPALAVDRKPDQYMLNAPRSGGKTMFGTQAGRNVEDMRFHTSARFDYVDGWQDAPYAIPNVTARHDYYGLYPRQTGPRDPEPVTSVRALRQVHYLRQHGLYVIADRIEAPTEESHEYTQFFALPARLPSTGFSERVALLKEQGNPLVEEDRANGVFRTRNPGFDNVILRLVASEPMRYANRLNSSREHVTDKTTLVEEISALNQRGVAYNQIMNTFSRDGGQLARLRPVSARWEGKGRQSLISVIKTLPSEGDPTADATLQPADLADFTRTTGEAGVIGFTARTAEGVKITFQSGPNTANVLSAGPLAATAESLLVEETGRGRGTGASGGTAAQSDEGRGRGTRDEGELSGIAIGCTSLTIDGKEIEIPCADFEFAFSATDESDKARDKARDKGDSSPLATRYSLLATPIHRPIDTVRIRPEQNVFTDHTVVAFDIPTQPTDDIEFHYTLDGTEPTLESKCYTKPFTLTETTRVKVRPFRSTLLTAGRRGLRQTPAHFTTCDSGRTMQAIFRKEPLRPAMTLPKSTRPGLNYEYFEGDWPTLFAYAGSAGVLDPHATGAVDSLLNPAKAPLLRKPHGTPYAVRYSGFLTVPESAVYTFHAPEHLFSTTMDAGYDMRVFVAGQEWFPAADTHATDTWSVALAAGPHHFEVAYVDYRQRPFRNEMWMTWQSEQMWRGTPVLELSGPGLERQPVPPAWLKQ